MSLTCWLDWDGEVTIVRIRGKIHASTAGKLSRCLQMALMDARAGLVLDLAETTYIDTQGLGALDRFFQECQEWGRTLALTNASALISRFLDAGGFDRVRPILEPVSE